MAPVLGLRPFDAGLIIAIVQDAARCGSGPLDATTERSLSLIRSGADGREDRDRAATLMVVSVCMAAVVFALLVAWLGAG